MIIDLVNKGNLVLLLRLSQHLPFAQKAPTFMIDFVHIVRFRVFSLLRMKTNANVSHFKKFRADCLKNCLSTNWLRKGEKNKVGVFGSLVVWTIIPCRVLWKFEISRITSHTNGKKILNIYWGKIKIYL